MYAYAHTEVKRTIQLLMTPQELKELKEIVNFYTVPVEERCALDQSMIDVAHDVYHALHSVEQIES